jgi:predicted peroxiredoxin
MMENPQHGALQVLIASGPEAVDRAVLGFAFALAATTCGADVTIVLTLKGTAWAKKDIPEARQTVTGFSSVGEYMDILADSGAVVRLCSSCAERNCTMDWNQNALPPSALHVGLAEVVLRTVRGAAATVVF